MTPETPADHRALIKQAFVHAIERVGLARFKQTALFGRAEIGCDDHKETE